MKTPYAILRSGKQVPIRYYFVNCGKDIIFTIQGNDCYYLYKTNSFKSRYDDIEFNRNRNNIISLTTTNFYLSIASIDCYEKMTKIPDANNEEEWYYASDIECICVSSDDVMEYQKLFKQVRSEMPKIESPKSCYNCDLCCKCKDKYYYIFWNKVCDEYRQADDKR